jgi:3-oxoacyl-[acyl-carrier protein] reductase
MADLGLKGQKALITGGSRGFGRSAALLLAAEGVDVAVNYVSNAKAAQDVVRKAKEMGVRAIAVQADVADEDAVVQMVARVKKEFGRIDILIHSAGISGLSPETTENWDRVIKVHLYSTYFLGREIAPIMTEQKHGKIVIVSSIGAHQCGANAYCCGMAGKVCYAKGLAKSLASSNVTVNTVSPGNIFTEMLDPFVPADQRRPFSEKNIPLYRSREGIPEADEVGKVLLFLVSDLASHITGQDIAVNGGQDIHY